MEAVFLKKLQQNRLSQKCNSFSFSLSQYSEIIAKVKCAKRKLVKEPRDYKLIKRFDVLEVAGTEKLIVPVNKGNSGIVYFVHDGELFDILTNVHNSIGHGGRDRMIKQLKIKYRNITYKDVKIFLSVCEPCLQKQKRDKKGIAHYLCHVDLIDYQSRPDGEYNFVMVYQDHSTKFVVLKALPTKKPKEIADQLIDIFTLLGAPTVLQSYDDRSVIENLKVLWPDLKLVHRTPAPGYSQNFEDVDDMLNEWMRDNNTSHWAEGLRFVQLMKNKARHAGIDRSPYEALFGNRLKLGLVTSAIQEAVQEEWELENVTDDNHKEEMLDIVDENQNLKEELDVHVDLAEAEATLAGLLEDRATLQQQLDELRSNADAAESLDIKTIEEDIELRSVQIQDLQQKLLNSDEENKAKIRFDTVQSMVEAKYALRSLFDRAADYHKEKVQVKREMSDLLDSQRELLEKNDQLMIEMQTLEGNYAEHIANQEKTRQETIGLLLKQIRGIKTEDVNPESELVQRCQIQSEQIEHQEELIEEQCRTIAALRQTLADIERESSSLKTTEIKLPKIKKAEKSAQNGSGEGDKAYVEMMSDLDDSFREDDIDNDPDWRKTPLAKKIRYSKQSVNKLLRVNQAPLPNELLVPGGSKRSSEGGCTCKTSCTARCGCRKTSKSCGESCKCSELTCKNREDVSKRESSSSVASNSSTEENFKKPRVDNESAQNVTKRKFTGRHLFNT